MNTAAAASRFLSLAATDEFSIKLPKRHLAEFNALVDELNATPGRPVEITGRLRCYGFSSVARGSIRIVARTPRQLEVVVEQLLLVGA